MTARQGICKSYLLEREQGIHVWGTDVMKLALFTTAASPDPDTVTAYSAANEISGTGYVAGGYALAMTPTFPKLSATSRKVLIDFVDLAINPAGPFSPRWGLIYNYSKSNRAVAVLDLGKAVQVTTSLNVIWPTPDETNAIIRLGA